MRDIAQVLWKALPISEQYGRDSVINLAGNVLLLATSLGHRKQIDLAIPLLYH